jgi:lipopolysaccharide biosynthesis glycosyltransferase
MAEKGPIQVFFSSDENYVPHLAAAMVSIMGSANPQDRIAFHVLGRGLSGTSRARLSGLVEGKGGTLRFLGVTPETEKLFEQVMVLRENDYVNVSSYLRLAMGELFPDLHRILYLDCDIIVRKSLSPLWETDLNGGVLAAVEDQGFGEKMDFEKGLLGVTRYFNSGVLLVDLDQWREQKCGSKCLEFARTNTLPTIWHDQTILNAVFRDQVLFLGQEWNLMAYDAWRVTREGKVPPGWETPMADPSIVHYTAAKPWLFETRHVPFGEGYWKALAETPWGGRETFEEKIRSFRRARVREAWRHPREALLALVGLGDWLPVLPRGLDLQEQGGK